MSIFRTIFMAAAIVVLTFHQAWAVDTTQTYQSGVLVLIFLGICALIVVAQMVPALILMMGTVSAFTRQLRNRKRAAVTDTGQQIAE